MTSHRFTVERIDVPTKGRFEDATALLEKNVPMAEVSRLAQLVESRATSAEVQAAVGGSAGDLEFVILAKLEQGALTSLLGTPKKISTYLIGNPVIANRMFERDRAAGLYAPLRVTLYEDPAGTVHFAYDRPSTLLGSFEDAEIDAVARVLDEKMATLAARLVQ
jgi:hypothetical protein